MTGPASPRWQRQMLAERAPLQQGWVAGAHGALGWTTIVGDEHGIDAIFLDDEATGVMTTLERAFPTMQLRPDDGRLTASLARIIAWIDEEPGLPTPEQDAIVFRTVGSGLRQRVWSALCKIPAGTTFTYRQLAERVGRPDAVRAVAAACAANTFAVLVPCHRVLRSDGSISGYRWGVERKRRLLARERAASVMPAV